MRWHPNDARRHEEIGQGGIYVSGKRRGDTKKERKQESTCLGRDQKTRRKRGSRNLRVRGGLRRHEEKREEEIYVSEEGLGDTKKRGKRKFTCQRRA